MRSTYLVLDVSSAALPNAADFLDPSTPDGRLTDPVKIADDIRKKDAARLEKAGLDLDLAQITGIGFSENGGPVSVFTADPTGGMTEVDLIETVRDLSRHGKTPLVTYNGLAFDLPLVQRRARYLGVAFPAMNLDRYRTPHVDVMQVLSDRDPSRRRSLGFYVKRMGWTDLTKTLSGQEEGRVLETGQWAELAESLHHDATATLRLARWAGLVEAEADQARRIA